MAFEAPKRVFDRIDPRRLERLDLFGQDDLAALPLTDAAEELELDLRACLAAVSDQQAYSAHAALAFAPFEGCWLGSDLHDASRVYRHIWYPTEVEPGFAGQRVLMLDAQNRPTLAYDFCELGPAPRISGLVGERAHRGYTLPAGALLWLGEERNGQVSVHLERVWANGQLYDVRGIVVARSSAADPGAPRFEVRARSDWRYHRLREGAIESETP